MEHLVATDMFCGGGGTSTGFAQVCRELAVSPKLYALNHWPVALETHRRNHPWATHVSEEIERLNPLDVVTEGYLDALTASPTCTFFSIARGGKPVSDQLRSQPYEVLRWMRDLKPRVVLVENVPEFRLWGPLLPSGLPDPARKGLSFRGWVGKMRHLPGNYTVDWRILNAADFGGATSRRRFFLIARRDGGAISWPSPTHTPRDKPISGRKPWRAASEILDWSLVGQSLWTRSRPLSYATWRRILTGLERYGGPDIQPFVRAFKQMTGISDDPDAPREGGPGFILPSLGRMGKNRPRSLGEPYPTIVAGKTDNGRVVTPYLLRTNFDCFRTQGRMGAAPRSVEDPLQTVVATNPGLALSESFLVPVVGRRASDAVPPKPVSDPLPTLTGRTGVWLTNAVLVPRHGEREGQAPRTHSVDEPLPTIPATGEPILARGFLVKYYGNGENVESIDDPLPTLTTRDRCLLVRPVVIDGQFLDIRIRMVQPHELAAGMGFPKEYEFVGNRTEVVKQIGNAVEVNMARALVRSLLAPAGGGLDRFAA